jgi:hypothetical protein
LKGGVLISEIVRGDFTRKNGNTKRKIKVSVIGSYATTDIISLRKGDIVGEIYDICYVKEAVPFGGLSEEDLEELILSKPDYIIFDLFTDVYQDAVLVNQETEETGEHLLEGTGNSRLKVYQYSTDCIIQFRRGFDLFYQAVRNNLPNTKIVMHRIRMVSELMVGRSRINITQDIMNDINVSFFMLEEIVSKYNLKIIDVSRNMKTPEEDPSQNKCSHITDDALYCDRFIGQLNYYCLIDLI